MSLLILDALKNENFELDVGPAREPHILWKRLNKSAQVAALREALSRGEVTDEDLSDFVSGLVREFRHGERFPYDLALAAIAVAVERLGTKFADAYIRILAGLRLVELPSSRVAALCGQHRASIPKTETRELVFGKPQERFDMRRERTTPPNLRPTCKETNFNAHP